MGHGHCSSDNMGSFYSYPPGIAHVTCAWGLMIICLKLLEMKLWAALGDRGVSSFVGARRPGLQYPTENFDYAQVPYIDGVENHTALDRIRSRLRNSFVSANQTYLPGQVTPVNETSCWGDDMVTKKLNYGNDSIISPSTKVIRGDVVSWRRSELAAQHSPHRSRGDLAAHTGCYCETQTPCTK